MISHKKNSKTPLDVVAGWKASDCFIDGVEKALENRKRFSLKRAKL